MPSCLYGFNLSYICFIPTALLICTENTLWDITKDSNFVELFKKSFTSYVENGMSQLVETDIDILRNEQGGFSVTEDFKAKFYKFIVDHYLRKFHIFHSFALDTTNHCLCLNTARPGVSRVPASDSDGSDESVASASEGQALVLKQKKEKKVTCLRKLILKLCCRQRDDEDWIC